MNMKREPACDSRRQEIFEIVIEEFIKSARPVGSEFLAEKYDLKVSSATIRNDLAYLEELGFLTKPHASGGRIPTQDGWHYFIEEIREPSDFSENEAMNLKELIRDLQGTFQAIRNCVLKIFPETSDEFLKRFLINKLFNDYDGRK